MPNDGAPSGDTRNHKLPIPRSPTAPTVESGRKTTLEVAPPPYWLVRNEDARPWMRKDAMTWAIDPGTKKPLSEAKRIDLKRGDTNATAPFDWISDLQRDMWDFGYKAVLADTNSGALPATPEPDGRFDERCERVIRRFQIHARLSLRKTGNITVTVKPTYTGGVTGIVDDATKQEIQLWKLAGYTRALQPFDPENILAPQVLAGHFCPTFYKLLTVNYVAACDREDLEPYGPCAKSQNPDGFRSDHSKFSWHLVGLACDMNYYSTKIESQPWYYPKLDKYGYGEQYPRGEWARIKAVACEVGLAIADPEDYDDRHVEYHPLLLDPDRNSHWTTPPKSIQKFISRKGGNSLADIRKAWALAVDSAYATAVGDFPTPPSDVAVA